jgi:hypothetical protein
MAGRPVDIEEEGRTLVERLGGRWTERGGMCRCPAHDDRTPSLSVRPGRTRLLFHCFAGCEAKSILAALETGRLIHASAPGLRNESPAAERRRSAAAHRIWNEARSIDGTPAAHYLAGRGLRNGSPELRYHPRTPFGPPPLTEYRPALIAAVRDEAGVAAIHRTFIEPVHFRLAPIPHPRRGLGRFGTGAVRFGGGGAELGLAEGIETALSASALFKIPCWATLGTERFRVVRLPPEVRRLRLFLDHDAGGRRAERLARETFAGLEIEAHYPPNRGEDWNDVLISTGASRHPS